MALHFDQDEFTGRLERLKAAMKDEKLDAILLFAQESMYWLTGYDTFGYCFFQTLVVKADGSMVLLTRSADLRQARHTSNIERIEIWVDRVNADPTMDLKNLLSDLDLLGMRIGVEYDTHGMTGRVARMLDQQLTSFGQMIDASSLVGKLRLIKSPAEIAYVEKAASLADDALDAALPLIRPGGSEADILAAMQGAIFAGGGDYPANEFIIGSGTDALLCRYKAGRRALDAQDQLTLEWAGVSAHYHAAMMRTVVVGEPTNRHRELYSACRETIQAVEMVLRPGNTFGTVFRRPCQDHGRTRSGATSAECLRLFAGRPLLALLDGAADVSSRLNPQEILPNMSLFVHMIIMDSDTGTAMTLGQTYLTTDGAPKPLSRYGLDFISA